ncbi:MAG: hypothetical protein QOF05_721 [Sphingomonadales bacterium]|nr:hypothetical protein [Sphingomonadales bacterium]
MRFVLVAAAAALGCLMTCPAQAQSADVERLGAAMKAARWTGPMLASTAETLPQGHFYTEPYFYDVIVSGDHHPGSSGFYQYGLRDNLTVGFQPSFATATNRIGRGMAIGDFKLLSQLRLTHFTPNHRVPTIALVLNEVIPTGKFDHLGPAQEGHGSGAFATEIGVNVQHWFQLKNGRLLRARINVLQRFWNRTSVDGRSVYGTDAGFRGHARPGSRTTLIGAVEYSLTNEWVLALDVEADFAGRTTLVGRDGTGAVVRTTSPASRSIGFAPAIEYNWSPSTGALFGVWIVPRGHNTPPSVTPAIAISRFW